MSRKVLNKIAGLVLGALFLSAVLGFHGMVAASGLEIKVAVAYHPEYLKQAPHILAAYESVLQEEGVPFSSVNIFDLLQIKPEVLAKTIPAVIFPDALSQHLPPSFAGWSERYLAQGGNLAVIYDVGTKDENGFYLNKSLFADMIGINSITFGKYGAEAYQRGHVRFVDEKSRDLFQVPIGKTIDRLSISGYSYGELEYPIAKNEIIREIPAHSIFANAVTTKNEQYPMITVSEVRQGKILYVNLPLGHVKGESDDLLLSSVLRTFLFDMLGIPHLLNVEKGLGGIVINWHVDANIEFDTLPTMRNMGYLRQHLPASIHITASPFFEKPGDWLGFSACGQGRPLTRMLMNYGTVGSHGGWAHNWFSNNILSGKFKEKEIREYIARNNECVESVIGYKVTEYSAPNGVHPQPEATRILEELGVIAYYFTGDTGSRPNRTFDRGKMVSDRVIAFPIMPFGKAASLEEMKIQEHKKDEEVQEQLLHILDYVARNRTVRLFYSHPRDIGYYPKPMKAFFDKAEAMQANNEMVVRSMTHFAAFFLRFLKTQYSFSKEENRLVLTLANPQGLEGITAAIPKRSYERPAAENIMVREDDRYYYLTVEGKNETQKTLFILAR